MAPGRDRIAVQPTTKGCLVDMVKTKLSLSERVAERVKRVKKQARGGANRAQFLAVKDEVAKAIAHEWPVKDIWAVLYEEGAITFSYDAFNGYVNRLIKSRNATPGAMTAPPGQTGPGKNLAAKETSSPTNKEHPTPKPNTERAFVFDPKPKRRGNNHG